MTDIVDIYCRVSTDIQENNTSLDEQEAACKEYCQQNGLLVGEVHREVFSGYYYREREQLKTMRERYLSGKIQGVVIRTFDRLSRKEVHFGILLEEMEHHGITLYCAKEQLEDTLMGRTMRMFLGLLAEWEREKIADRMLTGRVDKATKGKVVSGWKPPYGWRWHLNEKMEKEHLEVHPEESQVVLWIAEQYADGASADSIVRRLAERGIQSPIGKEKWVSSTIVRILGNKRITGTGAQQFFNKDARAEKHLDMLEMADGTYPALISMELFERVQSRLNSNKQEASRRGQNPEMFLLRAGFAKCECGLTMGGCTFKISRSKGKLKYRYACSGEGSHSMYQVNSQKLDEIVWSKCQQFADHLELIEQAIELATGAGALESDTRSIDASVVKWRRKVENYQEDLEDESLRRESRAAIRQSLNHTYETIEKLEIERASIETGIIDKQKLDAAYQEILVWCRKVKESRGELSYERKRDFLRLLGVQVIVSQTNQYHNPLVHRIEVGLPGIQELLPGNDEKECLVTHSSKSADHKPCQGAW